MKLQYNGNIKNMIVRKYNLRWDIGEIKDVSKEVADELLNIDGFKVTSKTTNDKKEKTVKKESINFDLNNDEVVDKEE